MNENNMFDIDKIISTTTTTIDKLKDYKHWWDALILYFDYIKHSRIQKTNQVWCNDRFMLKSTWFWETRFRKAKNILKELWLIELIRQRRKDWTLWNYFVKINFIISWEKWLKITTNNDFDLTQENATVGETRTNALSNININAWSRKTKVENQILYSHKDIELLKKKLKEQYPDIKTYQKVIFKTFIIWLLKRNKQWLTFEKINEFIERNYEQVKKFYSTMRWLDWWEWGINIEKMFNWLDSKWKVPTNWKTQTLQFIKR